MGWIVQYVSQMSSLYLGVVLMWDASYGDIFVTLKDPMSDICHIDDGYSDATGFNENDVNEEDNYAVSEGEMNTPTTRTSNNMVVGGGTTSSRKEISIATILNEMQRGREECKSTQNKILQFMKSGGSGARNGIAVENGGRDNTDAAMAVEKISKTMKIISDCKKELKELKKKKTKCIRDKRNGGDTCAKMKCVKKDISKKNRLIGDFEDALESQQIEQQILTKMAGDIAGSNDGDDGDAYSEDSNVEDNERDNDSGNDSND